MTTAPVVVVRLDRDVVARARRGYPGYLAARADLYADGWRRVTPTRLPHGRG